MESEHYHQIIPDTLRKKIGQLVFGVADISPAEYVPEPKESHPSILTGVVRWSHGSEGDYRD